jgi:hypothetical protein
MPDPFPDPPIAEVILDSIFEGHQLVYLGHGRSIEDPLLTMDWEPASGHSRVWRTERSSTAPFPSQGAERTFASILGDFQVVFLAQSSDAFGNLGAPLTLGFQPGTKQARIWELDRAAANQSGADVDYLLPKVNQCMFSSIGPGHELSYLDHDAVLDWEPASGHARVWRLERSRTTTQFPGGDSGRDPLPTKTAENTFASIRLGHELVYMSGDAILDRDRASGKLRVWRYDRNVPAGDFLPGSPLHEVDVPARFQSDERLIYIGNDLVLAFAVFPGSPPFGLARLFEYDRVPTEDPLQLARADVAARSLPWVRAAREALGPAETSPSTPFVDELLTRHFRYQSASIGEAAALDLIRKTFAEVEAELASMANVRGLSKKAFIAFQGAGEYTPAATRERDFANPGVRLSPEYRRYGFTGAFFEGRGDEMRAAIMIHEMVHLLSRVNVDSALEWWQEYDTISADLAIRNPSTYATFARHVATGEELRFGLEPWR